MSDVHQTDAPRIRVALVDDQALFRAGIRMLVSSQADLEFVGEAGNGAAGVTMAAAVRPDVIRMSIRITSGRTAATPPWPSSPPPSLPA